MKYRKKSEDITIAAGQSLKEKNYWLDKLSGELLKSIFPYDYMEPAGKKIKSSTLKFQFSENLNAGLMKLGSGSDARLFMVLTAGVLVTLYKYTGSKDILVGTSIEKQDVEGDFTNTVLVLRNPVESAMTFKELLLQVRDTFFQAVENSNYPMETLLYQLNLPSYLDNRDNEFPLFDIMILLENIHSREYVQHIKNNVTFSFLRTGDTVTGVLEYNSLLYERSSVEGIVSHFTAILGSVLSNLDLPVSGVELLASEERHRLLVDFNRTGAEYPADKTLHRLFVEQVEKTSDNIAAIDPDSDYLHLTYTALNERSDRLAVRLKEKGVAVGTIVGLMTDICMEMVVGMTAILKAGGAFLPIEPDYPPERIEYMIDDSSASILLAAAYRGKRIQCSAEVIDLNDDSLYRGAPANPGKINRPGDLAYVIYTSGSTGKPKGVIVQHNNIVNQIYGFEKMFYTGCLLNHMLIAPFTFDPSVQHIFSPLTYGGKLFLVPISIKDDPKELLDFILSNEIDVFDGVPSQLDVLLEFAAEDKIIDFKYIILAGEVFSKNLYSRIKRSINAENVLNIYGPTEATINTTMYECGEEEANMTIPIGKPLRNYRVLDEDLNLLPVGVPGGICIGGDGLARGYINKPQLTGEKFIENPFTPGERIYRTGDFGRWLSDGNIEFLGRIDHQVKIRGQRIELEEIEIQLVKHDSIKEAVVIAREDKNKIKYLSAYMVTDGQLNISRVREHLMDHLPGYMVPGHFVELEQMPLTPNGKIDRKALQKIERSARLEDTEYVPPRNQVEEKLVKLWKSELGLDRVGIKDNYFNIGGDSIKSIRLINLVNESLAVNFKIVDLYENSTIEELAAKVNPAQREGPDDDYKEVAMEIEKLKNKILQEV